MERRFFLLHKMTFQIINVLSPILTIRNGEGQKAREKRFGEIRPILIVLLRWESLLFIED